MPRLLIKLLFSLILILYLTPQAHPLNTLSCNPHKENVCKITHKDNKIKNKKNYLIDIILAIGLIILISPYILPFVMSGILGGYKSGWDMSLGGMFGGSLGGGFGGFNGGSKDANW